MTLNAEVSEELLPLLRDREDCPRSLRGASGKRRVGRESVVAHRRAKLVDTILSAVCPQSTPIGTLTIVKGSTLMSEARNAFVEVFLESAMGLGLTPVTATSVHPVLDESSSFNLHWSSPAHHEGGTLLEPNSIPVMFLPFYVHELGSVSLRREFLREATKSIVPDGTIVILDPAGYTTTDLYKEVLESLGLTIVKAKLLDVRLWKVLGVCQLLVAIKSSLEGQTDTIVSAPEDRRW